MSLAIVGTDTGVGKTVVSALLLARCGKGGGASGPAAGAEPFLLRTQAPEVAYWKPVSTGVERDRDSVFIATRLADRVKVLEEEYRFTPPVSPHLAARMAGVEIDLDRLEAAWRRHTSVAGRAILLEGIGGVLVPLNDRGDLFADFLARVRIPVAVVARTTLGTINHTLLSLEALRRREIPVAGVILDGPPSAENREAIERFGQVEVVAEATPLLGGLNPSRAAILNGAATFDPLGVLARALLSAVARDSLDEIAQG